MESTSISDVRRMCQRGAFRAYVQGGKVFLEDHDYAGSCAAVVSA